MHKMADRLRGADFRKGSVFPAADFLEFPRKYFQDISGDFRKSFSCSISYFLFQVIQSSRPALQRFEEDEEEFARFQPQRQRNRG